MPDFTPSYAGLCAAYLRRAESYILKCSQMTEPQEIMEPDKTLEVLHTLCELREHLEGVAKER